MSAIDRSELDGYEALVSELRANAPVAPESLRERVFEGAPAPRRRRSRRQRLLFVVVPAAIVLAVGAALVHGFVSTGSHPTASMAPTLSSNVHGIADQRGTGTAAGPATTTPAAGKAYGIAHTQSRTLAPLKQQAPAEFKAGASSSTGKQLGALGYNSVVAAGRTPLKGAVAGAPEAVTIPKNRLVHAVATLQVQVASRSALSDKTNKASQIVGSFGGYAQSVRYQNSRSGYGEAVLQLRVPVQKAQAAIAKLSTLGKLLSQEVSTQDLQTKLTGENNGIGSLHRAIAVYEATLQTTLPASQRATIEIRLNNARHALSQLRHARTGTLASGATADISLLLTTRNHAVVVHHHHKSGRFGRLLGSAGGFLGLEGIIVLYALIVLFPIVLVAALVWWIIRERRRREERLLASA